MSFGPLQDCPTKKAPAPPPPSSPRVFFQPTPPPDTADPCLDSGDDPHRWNFRGGGLSVICWVLFFETRARQSWCDYEAAIIKIFSILPLPRGVASLGKVSGKGNARHEIGGRSNFQPTFRRDLKFSLHPKDSPKRLGLFEGARGLFETARQNFW